MIVAVVPYAGEPAGVLSATLRSVGALFDDSPIVVVGDGCDLSEGIDHGGYAEGFRFTRLPENRGCAAALNHGIRFARESMGATRIGRCDTGDEWRAAMSWVLGSSAPASFGESQLGVFNGWDSRIWYDNQFQASCTAFDVAVWDAVGGYDESLRFADDWDFAVKVQRYTGWEREFLAVARVDASGISAPGSPAKEARRAKDHAVVSKRAQAARRGRP